MKLAKYLFVFFSISITQLAFSQSPFYDEIQAFKKQDKTKPPPQHAILFVGSSSFNFWKDVQSYFPNHTIINRGFGGSSLTDVIYYANDIVFPYHPKQMILPHQMPFLHKWFFSVSKLYFTSSEINCLTNRLYMFP